MTVVQGGATSSDGSGSSGQPNTPFANENVQQLALTGSDQLALANSGGTDSNDSQFFINTGPTDALGYNYTVFGQMVSGQATLSQIAQLPVQANPATGEDSEPVSPLTITAVSLSTTNPNGVAIIDTTQAKPGETATITVTAHDPSNGTTASQSFVVTVGGYDGADQRITSRRRQFQAVRESGLGHRLQGHRGQRAVAGSEHVPRHQRDGTPDVYARVAAQIRHDQQLQRIDG